MEHSSGIQICCHSQGMPKYAPPATVISNLHFHLDSATLKLAATSAERILVQEPNAIFRNQIKTIASILGRLLMRSCQGSNQEPSRLETRSAAVAGPVQVQRRSKTSSTFFIDFSRCRIRATDRFVESNYTISPGFCKGKALAPTYPYCLTSSGSSGVFFQFLCTIHREEGKCKNQRHLPYGATIIGLCRTSGHHREQHVCGTQNGSASLANHLCHRGKPRSPRKGKELQLAGNQRYPYHHEQRSHGCRRVGIHLAWSLDD